MLLMVMLVSSLMPLIQEFTEKVHNVNCINS